MEKSVVGQNKTNNNNKQRRQRIEINGGGGGFAGILLLGGVAFTAAALVAATTFAKNNSNKRRKSIHHNKKEENEEEQEEEDESTDKTTTISSNKIQKFEQGRNELGLLSLLHHVPSSSPEESSSQLCSNSTSNVIEFGATTRKKIGSSTKIVISPCDDETDVAIKSFLGCGEKEQGILFNDNSSSSNRVPFGNSFGGRLLGINTGLVVDRENLNKEEEDNENDDDEFEEDNDNEDDEHESIEEKGEEDDSEGTGDSSRASNAEAIWPQELIEGEDNPLELKEMKTHNLVTEANKAFEELVREDAMKNDSLGIHQQNEREPGLTMVHHLTVSKSRFWLWSTLGMGLLLLVIHSLLHNIISSTL